MAVITNPMRILVRLVLTCTFSKSNLKILCHPICNWLCMYVYIHRCPPLTALVLYSSYLFSHFTTSSRICSVCVHSHTHAHAQPYIPTSTCTPIQRTSCQPQTHARIHTHTHTPTHTSTYTLSLSRSRSHTHTQIHTLFLSHTHTHIFICTHAMANSVVRVHIASTAVCGGESSGSATPTATAATASSLGDLGEAAL